MADTLYDNQVPVVVSSPWRWLIPLYLSAVVFKFKRMIKAKKPTRCVSCARYILVYHTLKWYRMTNLFMMRRRRIQWMLLSRFSPRKVQRVFMRKSSTIWKKINPNQDHVYAVVWALVSLALLSPMVRWIIKQSIDNDIDNPMIGVYYYCYEAVKAIFEKAKGKGKPMSTAESMLSGAIAGSAVVLATHPIWTVNVSGSKMVKVWVK